MKRYILGLVDRKHIKGCADCVTKNSRYFEGMSALERRELCTDCPYKLRY